MIIIKIDDKTRQQIEAFLPEFRAECAALAEDNDRLADVLQRDEKNQARAAELDTTEAPPTDKQLTERILCRERERAHSELRGKLENTIRNRKRAVSAGISDAAELFRASASAQLFADAEQSLKQSLPASVLADENFTFRLVSESAAKRNVARFVNSFSASAADDADTVIAQAERLAHLLEDILQGREITVPGNEAVAVESSA